MDDDANLKTRFEMLQQQKQLLKKAKSRAGQQPTRAMRSSRVELEQQFYTGVDSFPVKTTFGIIVINDTFLSQALEAQMQTLMNQHHMRTTFIGEAYPPSLEPISNLDPILLRDLRLEVHHRGRVLIAKAFCEPIRISSIQNAIEDVEGGVNRLSIYNLPSTIPMDRVLPKGAIIAVKEPYFKATADGGIMVRVDHPSDCVLLESHHSSVPPRWRKGPKVAMMGTQLKEEGNTAFKQGDWDKAIGFYTEALAKTDDNPDLRSTLHRNRAQAHLNLGQYEIAFEDAITAVVDGDSLPHEAKMLNVKSFFRAGRAQYHLGDFCLAKEYLDQALGLDPTDETVIAELARTKQRIVEQQTGSYDFAAMAQSATVSHKKLDHATFDINTRIASAGKRGRGLFATKDMKHGSLVLVEKAFCVVFEDELGKHCSMVVNINTDRVDFGTHAERLYEIIDKMTRNPKKAWKFLDLWDGGNFKGKKISRVDGNVVLDTFQVQAIAELNGFGCPGLRSSIDDDEDKPGRGSTGIWLQASYMNHSCIPNTARAFIGDMMIVRATRDIKAGEEVFTSYQPPTMAFSKRKEKFNSWGFQCDCPLCRIEKQLPASILTGREMIEQEAKDFIAANPRTQENLGRLVGAAKLIEAKGILICLEETYPESKYEVMPRLACVDIDLWLVQIGVSAVEARLSSSLEIAATFRVMKDWGYIVKVKGSKVLIDRNNGVVCPQVVDAAMYSRQAWRMAGKPDVAKSFLEFAKEIYLAICGAMDGFEDKFGDL